MIVFACPCQTKDNVCRALFWTFSVFKCQKYVLFNLKKKSYFPQSISVWKQNNFHLQENTTEKNFHHLHCMHKAQQCLTLEIDNMSTKWFQDLEQIPENKVLVAIINYVWCVVIVV